MVLASHALTYPRLMEEWLNLHAVSLEAELGMPDNRAASPTAHDDVTIIAWDLVSDPHNRWINTTRAVLTTVT